MWLRIPITSRQGISGRWGSNSFIVLSSIFRKPSPIASMSIQLAAKVFIPSRDESQSSALVICLFHVWRSSIARWICDSKSLTISSCLYDTDSISFYLFAEKGTHIPMFLHKVNVTTQQFLQVASGGGMVIKLRWHDSKEVNIASFVMLISGNRAKNAQGRDAETLLQLLSMTPDNINIFAL